MTKPGPLSIVPLASEHLEDAARLAAARYTALRRQVPELPARYEHSAEFLPRLSKLAANNPGVAALRGGKLAGFMAAYMTPNWRGRRSTYCPEWANGVSGANTRRVYDEMYTTLSRQWVAERYLDHLVTLFAHDRQSIEGWQWLGFGYVVIDALRGMDPVGGVTPQLEIRRAAAADWPDALALRVGLNSHLVAAPTFLVDALEPCEQEFALWLSNPKHALWLALRDGRAVASLGIGPANEDACTIIRDEGTASIVSAFTSPGARGVGVASALLESALAWARGEGYVRCAVDFETTNPQAARFWPRYFRPVCYSLGRVVNEHILDTGNGHPRS